MGCSRSVFLLCSTTVVCIVNWYSWDQQDSWVHTPTYFLLLMGVPPFFKRVIFLSSKFLTFIFFNLFNQAKPNQTLNNCIFCQASHIFWRQRSFVLFPNDPPRATVQTSHELVASRGSMVAATPRLLLSHLPAALICVIGRFIPYFRIQKEAQNFAPSKLVFSRYV